jgi:hypothetical protein
MTMRTSATILFLLLFGTAAAAQDAPETDFSKDTLLRLLHAEEARPEPKPRVDFHVGAVDFLIRGTSYRFNYLPFMVPLSGSNPRTSIEMPDPFALTHTSIASPPRVWRNRRAVNAELRRIDRSERARAKLRVKRGG